MDMGTIRGIVTLVLLLAFVGLVVWAYSSKRRRDFERAARLPLEDDPPVRGAGEAEEDDK